MRLREDRIPADAYRERLTIRSYEIGREGTVRPATLLRHLEHLATDASAYAGFAPDWYVEQGTAWVVHAMDLFIGQLPRFGDQLGMATWVAEFRRVQAIREYAMWHMNTGALVARAEARWAYIDRFRAVPVRLPEAMTTSMATYDHSMSRRTFIPRADARTSRSLLDHTAREYEVDSQQHINNCAYVDWLWEAARHALDDFAPAGSVEYQPRYYSLEYVKPTLPDEHVQITTRTLPPATTTPPRRASRVQIDQEIRHTSTDAVCLRAVTTYLRHPAQRS